MMENTRTDAEALGAAGPVVLGLAPEMGRWLFGPGAGPVIASVQHALSTVTGSVDPDVQAAALADANRAAVLRMALGRIAAERVVSQQQSPAAGVAEGQAVSAGALAYGAPLVSVVVLLTFAVVMLVALTRSMPSGAEPVLNVLLGTLGAMATSVVGYWVGSSAGSARKDERLATIAERG